MNEELKPCPFCGNMPEIKIKNWDEYRPVWVSCEDEKCEVAPNTHGHHSEKYAVEAWNKRA